MLNEVAAILYYCWMSEGRGWRFKTWQSAFGFCAGFGSILGVTYNSSCVRYKIGSITFKLYLLSGVSLELLLTDNWLIKGRRGGLLDLHNFFSSCSLAVSLCLSFWRCSEQSNTKWEDRFCCQDQCCSAPISFPVFLPSPSQPPLPPHLTSCTKPYLLSFLLYILMGHGGGFYFGIITAPDGQIQRKEETNYVGTLV